jgi:hypothetical protein
MRLPVSCAAVAGTSIGRITVARLSAARAADLRSITLRPAAAWVVTARGAVIRARVLRPAAAWAITARAAVIRARILRPAAAWAITARAAVIRARILRPAAAWAITARAAVIRARILRPAAAWAITARAAVIRANILRAAVILQPTVARARNFWPSVGGWDQGQRPEQQADEDLGAQQVHPSARTGGLHGLRHGTDPRPSGSRLRGWQEPSRQRGGAIVVTEQRDPRPPLCLLAAPLGGRRIGREHGPL